MERDDAISGMQTGALQEVDEEIQRRVVGVLVPADLPRLGVVGVCAGGEGSDCLGAHDRAVGALVPGPPRPDPAHHAQH